MSSALVLSGMTAAASIVEPSKVWGAVSHKPLDPVNPDILFGTTSSIWGRQHDLVWAVKRIAALGDRKSTRLNSSHGYISYAVFCLKKKKQLHTPTRAPPSRRALDPGLAIESRTRR